MVILTSLAATILEITGDYWRLLEITRDYWRLLEITRDLCSNLASHSLSVHETECVCVEGSHFHLGVTQMEEALKVHPQVWVTANHRLKLERISCRIKLKVM